MELNRLILMNRWFLNTYVNIIVGAYELINLIITNSVLFYFNM